MSVGQIALILLGILISAGACQRVLDKMGLTDRQALLFVAAILVGGVLPDLPIGNAVKVNMGGAVAPLALAITVWAKAGSAAERVRALLATLLTAVAMFFLARYFPNEPEKMPFDINYLYGLAAGVIAYVFGRSRRGAFIAGTVGTLLSDVAQNVILRTEGVEQTLRLGSAGLLDVIVISGVLATLLAELTGEFLERCSRGAERGKAR